MAIALLASMSFWLLTVFSISIAIFLSIKWWQMHPLYGKNIGPPVFPFVGSFFSLVRNQHRMYDWATQLLRHSPSLTIRSVLFGIELYITANPANVEHMLKTNFSNYTKGFRFQSLMQDMLGHGIFNADGELWKVQRKAASYEFTSNSLKTLMLETVQKEISDRLLPVLYSHIYNSSCSTCCSACKRYGSSPCPNADSHQNRTVVCADQTPIDLQDIFLRFAFDNICQISLGVDTACLNHALQNQGFAKAFDDATELIIQRFFVPAWIWKLKRCLNVGSERKLKKALHIVHSFATEIICRRKEECDRTLKDVSKTHQPTDLLNRLLSAAAQIKGGSELQSNVFEDKSVHSAAFGEMVREHAEAESEVLLRDMIISFLLAGRDTSSVALSWFFWLVVLHPPVEAAIYEEIMKVVHGREKSKGTDAEDRDVDEHIQHTGNTKTLLEMSEHRKHAVNDVHGGKGHAYDINCMNVAHKSHNAHDTNVEKSGHGRAVDISVGDGIVRAHGMDAGNVNDGPHMRLNQGRLQYEPFTYKELQDMKYLQAALQETMRLYPPVPHDTKLVVEGEILPDGTRVHSGAQLAYHVYAMGRMESLWGEDCEKFRPERWFSEDGLLNESPFKWPVFQAGPRTCLGKDMAMLQMKCVAAVLIELFTFSMPASFSAPTYSLSFTLKMQHGLPLLLHPRR